MEMINTIGRRKSSVARVYVTSGDGTVTVNGKAIEDYFTIDSIKNSVLSPFVTVDAVGQYNVKINVKGGGFKGQAEAARMAISRALVKINEDFKSPLKAKKYLTRDAREVERKKFGKPKARKSFQFSKR